MHPQLVIAGLEASLPVLIKKTFDPYGIFISEVTVSVKPQPNSNFDMLSTVVISMEVRKVTKFGLQTIVDIYPNGNPDLARLLEKLAYEFQRYLKTT